MKPDPPRLGSCRTREILVVIALTLVGGLLRLWSIGRLGLSHFDEGIYAASGLWIFARHGLLDIDPTLIAYAPPGFPFLVGIAYFILGASDLSAILVSITLGTLTIPAVAWLAHRTFGNGAGGVAAAFLAISGSHVAFSRMALTDVSFLLFWVLALIAAQRFLEKPRATRAVLLGLAVGAAQLFKYNGWLAGAAAMLAALVWPVFHRSQWRTGLAATWAWGFVAASVAAVVYWPWFTFVQSHGGYAALLAHERGYLGGFNTWPAHLAVQLAQARALSGGAIWLATAGLVAAAAMLIIGFDSRGNSRRLGFIFLFAFGVATFRVSPDLAAWVPLYLLPILMCMWKTVPSKRLILLYSAWLMLALLTPFYHPYARLWLPLHALECILLGGMIGLLHSRLETLAPTRQKLVGSKQHRLGPDVYLHAFLFVSLVIHLILSYYPRSRALPGFPPKNPMLPGVLAPTDSLKTASAAIAHDLPKPVKNLRVVGRPPLTFYLGQTASVAIEPQANLSGLFSPCDESTWALLDTAIVRQDEDLSTELNRLSAGWTLVLAIPAPLSLPVLLDVDPSVASSRKPGVQVELRLMRPKRAGDPP